MKRLAVAALLLLGACQVESDPKNDSVSVAYDENSAEEAGNRISAAAGDIAEDIRQDVGEEGERLKQVADNLQTDDRADDKAPATNSN